ncbi:MAG: hypothetical protein KC493_02805 [Bacteriovoracaceae bacterium]|nr:hypothetical protein [Bacteriovoracaceae bacterium]
MRKMTISLLALTVSMPLIAEEPDMCKLSETQASSSTALTDAPSYFISPDPNGKYVGVIGDNAGNTIVNLETGKATKVPGSVDPVFTPDGKYLTLPGGTFYDYKKDIKPKADSGDSVGRPSSIHNDGMDGVYQSLGAVKTEGSKTTYRMIDDTMGVSWQDYTIDSSNNRVKQKMGRNKKLCGDVASDTPMLSKDGKYLSIYNKTTGTTQIYNIEDNVNNGGKCNMVLDLGFPTGKVSFDYTNGQIAFHVDSVQTQANYFSGVSSRMRKDSFVLKIDKSTDSDGKEKWVPKAFTKMNLTKGKAELGTGTYYPRFRKDGSIVTVVQHKSGMQNYSLDVVKQNDIAWQPFKAYLFNPDMYGTCNANQKKEIKSLYALGELWSQICGKYNSGMRFKDTLKIPFGMDHESCVALIKKQWKGSNKTKVAQAGKSKSGIDGSLQIGKINELSVQDLEAVCPPKFEKSSTGRPRMAGMFGTRKPRTGPEILEAKCAGCHESRRDDRPFIDFSNPSKADINQWAQHTFNKSLDKKKQMPPADENQLEDDEQTTLKKYFIDVLSGRETYQRAIPPE